MAPKFLHQNGARVLPPCRVFAYKPQVRWGLYAFHLPFPSFVAGKQHPLADFPPEGDQPFPRHQGKGESPDKDPQQEQLVHLNLRVLPPKLKAF